VCSCYFGSECFAESTPHGVADDPTEFGSFRLPVAAKSRGSEDGPEQEMRDASDSPEGPDGLEFPNLIDPATCVGHHELAFLRTAARVLDQRPWMSA